MSRYQDVADFMSPSATDRLKVLVPLDGSQQAERALVLLSAIMPLAEISAFLVSVVDDRDLDLSAEPSTILEKELHLREVYLRETVKGLQDPIAESSYTVTVGTPASCILEEAARIKADLIVISGSGRSGINRWRLGSVADKVVRASSCDTLVVGSKEPEAIRAILVPLDGSALAESAIPVATRFAAALGSELHIVRVVVPPIAGLGATRYGYNTPQMLEALTGSAEGYIAGVKEQHAGAKASVRVGGASEVLEQYIEAASIDLVVMTSHGRGGLRRAALGSVTDRLLGGPSAVLVVKPDLPA